MAIMMDELDTPKIYTCSKCGLESTVERAFARQRTYVMQEKLLCPKCLARQQQRQTLLSYILIPILWIGLTLLNIESLAPLTHFFLNLTIALVMIIPLLLVHELAHAVVAAMTGFRVFGIVLGSGKPLAYFRWLGVNWNICVLPISGATFVAGPRSRLYRLRFFCIYLAGPLTHLALAGGFFFLSLLLYWSALPEWVWRVAVMGLVLNGILFIVNIFPSKVASNFGVTGTDGWQLVHLFSLKEEDLSERDANYYAYKTVDELQQNKMSQAKQWIERGLALHPDNLMVVNAYGIVKVYAQDYVAARETFLKMLAASEKLKPEVLYMAMNNVAYSNLMLNDSALFKQTDKYSARAYQNMPWVPSIAGTRGAVLVRMGKVEDGLPLLRTAFLSHPDKKSKAGEACFLAEAEWRRGNLVEARRWVETTRRLDPACPLLPGVEQMLGQAAPGMEPAGG